MTKLKKTIHQKSVRHTHWGWILPILALSPLTLAAKGCNSGVVGNDCPTPESCPVGSAGAPSQDPVVETCGGLTGASCAKGEFCDFPSSAMCGAGDQTGVCKATPEACQDIYLPVCGCDGKTYGNACEANGAGVSVARAGECQTEPDPGGGGGGDCGGLQGLACAANEYCSFPPSAQCGAADQTGKCTVKPAACDLIYAPVCGCDGKTYGNECAAAADGISVAHSGECQTAGSSCGTRGAAGCAANQYCYYSPEDNCGRADAPGVCTDIPKDSACLTIYDPVCGCDGKTYSNDCEARLAGASVDHEGACGEVCGGFIGATCEAGSFCNYPPDAACGFADASGNCQALPAGCDKILKPVCGCDGKTYSNECVANSSGISVASQGECN